LNKLYKKGSRQFGNNPLPFLVIDAIMDICDALPQNHAATHSKGNRLVLIGVLVLDNQHRDIVKVGVVVAKLAEQRALSFSVARVQFPHIGIK